MAPKKDPNAPKRPMSAYFLFMGDKRAEVKEKNPDFKIGDIAKVGYRVDFIDSGLYGWFVFCRTVTFFAQEMGRMWGEIDAKDKDKYQKEADKLKIQYEKDKAAYEAGK